MLQFILQWQNLVFCLPIAFGIVLVLGSAFGFGDAGGDADVDLDADADLDVDGSAGGFNHLLGVLGVGKVPLIMVLMMASFIFGGAGLLVNSFLSPLLPPIVYAWISMVAAFATMFIVTGRVAKVLARFLPSAETYRIDKFDLCGVTGELTLPCKGKTSRANVKAPDGTVFKIAVRSDTPLEKGTRILVIDYDQDADTYLVAPDPSTLEDDGATLARIRVPDAAPPEDETDRSGASASDRERQRAATTTSNKENN